MAETTVLVVDDSLTMRALISRVLDGLPGIKVVGAADGAVEARREVERLKPHVITLDVEMPGISGIEYLAELMHQRPTPVIMFSTRTEAGSSASIDALRLGAIDCFPKPKAAAQAEFDEVVKKLGKRIKTAKLSLVKAGTLPPPPESYDWNGRMLAIGTDASGTRRLFQLLGSFPKNCPPTLIVPHISEDLVNSLIEKLNEHARPDVLPFEDFVPLEQGKVYVSRPGAAHVGVDVWPGGRMRRMVRDPIAGERPSISLLFAAMAKAACVDSLGVMLTEAGEDGPAGLKAIVKSGGHVLAPAPLLDQPGASAEFVLQKGLASEPLEWHDVPGKVLALCRK